MAEDEKKLNIFLRKTVYPDAEGIFSFRPKSLDDIKDDCFVVLDTNSLLVPYTTGKDSLEQIGKIYNDLVKSERLIVPGQVAREFAEHRVTKLKELYQQIFRKRASIGLGNYPLLGALDEYQKALELEKTLNTSIGAYNEAIDSLLDVIRQWYWNDPVSALYGELFVHSAILDPAYDEKEMTERLERDVLYKLPPGYKDARKKDDGIGDLLIWQTILDAGVKNKKSVIFVSLDQKADWWSQSEGSALYPRFELVDEFRRASDGQSFHAIKFSRFLNLYGASKDVVEEVRKEEQQVGAFHFDSGAPWSYEALIAQNSVYDWLKASYPYCLITSHEKGFDYVIVDQENRRIAVEIKLFRDAHISVRRFKDIASQILKLLKVERFDEVLIILVGSDEKAAFSLLAKIDGLKAALPMAKMVTGFLSSSGDFFTYPYTEEP